MDLFGRIFRILLLTLTWTSNICGNFPLLDVDTNMRIVLVPYDMPIGIPFYRIKATDSDHNFPLSFEVLGSVGSALLDLQFLGCSQVDSLCQADVLLKKQLDLGRTYEFQLRVTDTTGDFTRVKAAISATQGSAYFPSILGPKSLTIPENAAIGSKLTTFIVRKNELNSRMVLLELREPEGRIELRQRLLSNNRTEGTLLLQKKLDYEKEPWFTFQLLAMNGHTNLSTDTRNVLLFVIMVGVEDIQDCPPFFTSFTPYVEIPLTMLKGDLVTRVAAEDGDRRNKRVIRYGLLTDSNPFVGFFDLDPMTGEIHLKRSVSELVEMARPNEHIILSVMAEEIVPPSESPTGLSRFRRSGKESTRIIGNITFWINQSKSSKTHFLQFSSQKYIGEIEENAPVGSLVRFSFVTKILSSSTEVIWLSLEDKTTHGRRQDKHLTQEEKTSEGDSIQRSQGQQSVFQLIPEEGHGNFTFQLRVLNPEKLDFEQIVMFKLEIHASTLSGLNSTAQVEVHVRDENDCKPVFVRKEYYVELDENSPPGTSLVQVQATDCDTVGNHATITYSIQGKEPFQINPVTGQITVDNSNIDRESQPEFRFYVTATDGSPSASGISNSPASGTGRSSTPMSSAVQNTGVALVIVKLLDENDETPIFRSSSYQVVLTPELDDLKKPLHVKATDADQEDSPNAQVRYQVLGDSRFKVDPVSGEVKLKRKLTNTGSSPYLGSFRIEASDQGSPPKSSETTLEVYSEEITSQDLQFLFPSSPGRIQKDREKIEEMLSSLVKGHATIRNITLYEEPKVKGVMSLKLQEARYLEENENDTLMLTTQAQELGHPEQQRKSTGSSEKTLVTTRVNTPKEGTNRVFDLEALKTFMIVDETRVTTTPGNGPEIVKADSQNLFWILISLIVLLLILVLIFLICIFCPCCWYNRSSFRKSKAKIQKVSSRRRGTEREFEISDSDIQKPAHVPRKQIHTILENSDDYNVSLNRFPRAREAWSGDERFTGRTRMRPQVEQAHHQQRQAPIQLQRDELEDWEIEESRRVENFQPKFGRQQQKGIPREESSVQRWRVSETQPSRSFVGGRNRVGDANGGFVRHLARNNEGYFTDRVSDHGGNYGYHTSERRVIQQYSPPHSLPPAPSSAEYQRNPRQRFFRTDMGEVLQFDFEGEEGKEMLMRRFIHDQNKPRDSDERQVSADVPAYIRPEVEQARIEQSRLQQSHAQSRVHQRQAEHTRTHPKVHRHDHHVDESERHDRENRPKAAAGSRRHLHPSREIPEVPEEDEVPNHEEESKSHRKTKHRAHKEATRSKSEKSKDRSRSRETEDENMSPVERRRKPKRQTSKSPSTPTVDRKSKHGQSSKSPIPQLLIVEDEADDHARSSSQGHKEERSRSRRSKDDSGKSDEPAGKKGTSPIVISKEIQMDSETVEGRNFRIDSADFGVEMAGLLLPEDLDRLLREEDEDSGIGLVGNMAQRSKMLEKKSVFTIAYDEMATQNVLRPDTALNNGS